MTKIVAISGSLRKGSFNTALVRAAADMYPDAISVHSLAGIPLYNGDDEEADGVPTAVEELKQAIAEADGLIISTPEYNNSMPGVLKNALDWLTRPPADIPQVFHGKPVAVMGATPGGFGTNLAQNSLLPVLRTMKTQPWFEGRLMVSHASKLVEDAELSDDKTRERLQEFVSGFIDFCAQTAS